MVNIQFVNFTSLPPYGTEHFLLCLLFASFFSYFSGKLLLKCDNYLICVLSLVIFDIFNSSIIMLYFLIPFPGFRVSFLLLFLHYFSLCCHLLVWLSTCGGYLILSQIVEIVLERTNSRWLWYDLIDFWSLRKPHRSHRAWVPLHFPVEETDPVRCHACDFLHNGRKKLDPGLGSHDSFHSPMPAWC